MEKKKEQIIDYDIVIYNKITQSTKILKLNVKNYDECYNEVFNYAIQLNSCFIKDGLLTCRLDDHLLRSFIIGELYFETRLLTFFIHPNYD
jgi:hypothetical protein